MKSPIISVIMPVYNTEKYVGEAIESILNQTFTNFEFIIIDDASTDNSVTIIKSFKDSRINLIIKPQNTGYTQSLNIGLALANGKYIARMDSDDISLPFRFEKQFELLESDENIGVCGGWYKVIGTENIKTYFANHDQIKVAMLSECSLGHPTVMIRKSVLTLNKIQYDASYEPSEDYHLWTKLSNITHLANIEDVLLQYRVHSTQVSSKKRAQQLASSDKIMLMQLQNFDIKPNENQQKVHLALTNMNKAEMVFITHRQVYQWLNIIFRANRLHNHYTESHLVSLLRVFWFNFLLSKLEYNLSTLCYDISSTYSIRIKMGNWYYLKFVIKCLIKYRS